MIYILKFYDENDNLFDLPFDSMKGAKRYFAMEKNLWKLDATILEMQNFKMTPKLRKPLNQTEWVRI